MARSYHGGENRTAVRASYHEELCSDGVMAPPGVGSVVGSDLGVVLDRGPPGGSRERQP